MLRKLFSKPKQTPKKNNEPAVVSPGYQPLLSKTRNEEDAYKDLYDLPDLPDRPTYETTAWKANVYSNEGIEDLPLQTVSSNRRVEDLDDEEYGYSCDLVYKKKGGNFEDVFMDAQQCGPYHENSHRPMINRLVFTPKGQYNGLSVYEICQKFNNPSEVDQKDLRKFIVADLLPDLREHYKMMDLFILLSCKNKIIRAMSIHELKDMILEIEPTSFPLEELMKLYELGTVQLFSAITETKKTSSIFQHLIHVGIMFNCFIYLKAIESMDDWEHFIRGLLVNMQSKMKRVMQRTDPDVRVFTETAKCIFQLENTDVDNSLLVGEDEDDFLPEFSRNNSSIYIEGLASLFHTGNLILRQQSKFKPGVKRLVRMTSFMNGSDDEGMVKWFHLFLGQIVLRILYQEHHNHVKQDVLDKCEDELLFILRSSTFHPAGFDLTHSLLFHKKERVRSRYREIAKKKKFIFSRAITYLHIQHLLYKFGIEFDISTSGAQLNDLFERKECTFCDKDASITIFYDEFPEDKKPNDVETYLNVSCTKILTGNKPHRKVDLANELEVLKEIESKEIHRNVTRLLVFNQSFPKFYIKERLLGDNLQRRLLEARSKKEIIPISDLIRIIIQTVQGVIYVHSNGCLLRDITTASFGCTITENSYFLKLKNFEKAARPSEFSKDGIISGLTDLNFSGVPIRWAAPESLLEGHYSIYSDVWSVNILADEILNYAAWPYSDISNADINDMIINIVFTHLKPQGFNRPKRVQGLILEGLADLPEKRLKLEALLERLREILDNIDGGGGYAIYDTYSGGDGASIMTYEIPKLTERQIKANSIFERGIPPSIQKYRELDEDPNTIFASEIVGNNTKLKKQAGIDVMEISSVDNYKIEYENGTTQMCVTERVTDDFVRHTYHRLKEIDSKQMCVNPWPPRKSSSADGIIKLNYKLPRSTHLLDIVLYKSRGETIGPYIELLFELANHVDSFHSAGWIFRSLRAKNVWILDTNEKTLTIVVPRFGKYRMIVSSECDTHLEQIKVADDDLEGVQWLPIEAIKAGLYSKESDVYAFGMITWEVMSAFGQDGVIYDQDEEQELMCIPFNYQQSENILQHLIEGYIPEKPLKCPNWFYQEITRPCLLHQKIDRPSMKTILQILQIKLCKTLPKQILCRQRSNRDTSEDEDSDAYEVCPDAYEYYEDFQEAYDDMTLPQYFIEESETPNAQNPAIRRLPPPIPGSHNTIYEIEEEEEEDYQPPPLELKSLPPKICNSQMTSEKLECSNDSNDTPPITRRTLLSGISGTQEEFQISDIHSCKSLPLPNIPEKAKNDEENPNNKLSCPSLQNSLQLPPKLTKCSTENNLETSSEDAAGKNKVDQHTDPERNDKFDQHCSCSQPVGRQMNNTTEVCCPERHSVYSSSDFLGEIRFQHQDDSLIVEEITEKRKNTDLASNVGENVSINSHENGQNSTLISTETPPVAKTKPKEISIPISEHVSCVNTQKLGAKNKPSAVPEYMNQKERKPALPPRMPLNK